VEKSVTLRELKSLSLRSLGLDGMVNTLNAIVIAVDSIFGFYTKSLD
jgi:hypothetical protein